MGILVRDLRAEDLVFARSLLSEHWGEAVVIARGVLHLPLELPTLVAERDGRRLGLCTYRLADGECQIVTLDAAPRWAGAGTALVEEIGRRARAARCERIWLVTSNDNLDALRFYQRRGFVLVAVHSGAIERARLLEPTIPREGAYRIPLRDEIELERRLRG